MDTPFGQTSYQVRFEWGPKGARDAAERHDIVVIVDVLSFSSAVTAALSYGAIVYPEAPGPAASKRAIELNAMLAVRRSAAQGGAVSLSPVSWNIAVAGKKVVLPSPNGAVCSHCAEHSAALITGGIVNASAIAKAAGKLQQQLGTSITVIAAGERWEHVEEGENVLRPSIEDYLGAGVILSQLNNKGMSPEAFLCQQAFKAVEGKVEDLIWESGSGRELRTKGYGADVRFSTKLNSHTIVPVLEDGKFVDLAIII